MTEARIAGKVMLSGEYAVLYDAPAVLLPVPRHLTVYESKHRPLKPLSRVAHAASVYPVPALRLAERELPPLHCVVDQGEFITSDKHGRAMKLGIGTSAAEAVGVLALRYLRTGMDWREHQAQLLTDAIQIHVQAQANIGSGADVAACVYGKPIKFCRSGKTPVATPLAEETSPAVPLALVWTGQPADTRKLVRQFCEYVQHNQAQMQPLLRKLESLAAALGDAWFDATPETLYGLVDEYCAEMRASAAAANLPWELKAHQELAAWARKHDGRAKPTGAGGGDMVLLIGDLPLQKLEQHGALVIRLLV